MKPVVPARVVGGSILVEASPLAVGVSKVYRGVDLGARLEQVAGGSRPGASPRGPYREAPAVAPSLASVPVIVREVSDVADDEPEIQLLFEQATLSRHRMTGSPTPRLLHTFGRGKKVLASVEEYVCGATLEEVLRALRASGERMPVAIALAIGQGLLPLWIIAASASPPIRFLVDPAAVILDAAGRVRVLRTAPSRPRPRWTSAFAAWRTRPRGEQAQKTCRRACRGRPCCASGGVVSELPEPISALRGGTSALRGRDLRPSGTNLRPSGKGSPPFGARPPPFGDEPPLFGEGISALRSATSALQGGTSAMQGRGLRPSRCMFRLPRSALRLPGRGLRLRRSALLPIISAMAIAPPVP
jgi:hypothetical protein